MNTLWRAIQKNDFQEKNKIRLFLLLNTLIWIFLPTALFYLAGTFITGFTFMWIETYILVVGYAGTFVGYLGGLFFLLRHTKRVVANENGCI